MAPVILVVVLGAVGVAAAVNSPSGATPNPAYFPDLRTVVPLHLNLVNQGQNEYLRFSNGIANTGPRAVGAAGRARPHLDGAHHHRLPGDPHEQRAVPLRDTAEAGDRVLRDPG